MHPLIFDLGTFELGPVTFPLRLPSYGLAMLLGMVLGWFIVRRFGRRVAPDEPWLDFYTGLLLAGLVGAKLLFAVVELPALLAGELRLRDVLLAGGVWLGGVLGGLAFCWHYFRRSEVPAGVALNVLFTALPLSHAVGRIGCFLAGCCYGAGCARPWAVIYTSPDAARYAGTPLGVPLHPVPLYEVTLELVNFAVCLSLWRKREPAPWLVFFTWIGLYGMQRFVLEFFRGDPRGSWSGLSTSQWLTGLMVVVAVAWFVRRRAVDKRSTAD